MSGAAESEGRGAGAVIVALAPAAALLVLAVIAIMEARGARPLGDGSPLNIAEAASWGLAADALRLAAAGQAADRQYPVRPQFISSEVTTVSAIEAAIWSREPRLVSLMIEAAKPGDAERERLACLARDIAASDIAQVLQPAARCRPGAALSEVKSR
jgi:hypothetical protein